MSKIFKNLKKIIKIKIGFMTLTTWSFVAGFFFIVGLARFNMYTKFLNGVVWGGHSELTAKCTIH